RHAPADDAGDDVVGTAGRKRHDQFDGFCWKILRGGRVRQQQHQASHDCAENPHASPLTDFCPWCTSFETPRKSAAPEDKGEAPASCSIASSRLNTLGE